MSWLSTTGHVSLRDRGALTDVHVEVRFAGVVVLDRTWAVRSARLTVPAIDFRWGPEGPVLVVAPYVPAA